MPFFDDRRYRRAVDIDLFPELGRVEKDLRDIVLEISLESHGDAPGGALP